MFGGLMNGFGAGAKEMQMLYKLMQNEDFKRFITHPKIQELFKDPEFQMVAKSRDFSKILSHPKFAEAMKDPELAALMVKVNPQELMKGA